MLWAFPPDGIRGDRGQCQPCPRAHDRLRLGVCHNRAASSRGVCATCVGNLAVFPALTGQLGNVAGASVIEECCLTASASSSVDIATHGDEDDVVLAVPDFELGSMQSGAWMVPEVTAELGRRSVLLRPGYLLRRARTAFWTL
jgi:hypothetical protein